MKAIKTVAKFELTCPKCYSSIACRENGGSFLWPIEAETPKTVECFDCKAVLEVPKGYRKEAS